MSTYSACILYGQFFEAVNVLRCQKIPNFDTLFYEQIFNRVKIFTNSSFKMDFQNFFSNTCILNFSAKSAKIFKCIPFNITPKSNQKYQVSAIDSKSLYRLKLKTFLATFLVTVLLFQCIHDSVKSSQTNMYQRIISWFSFFLLTIATYDVHEIQQNLNSLIIFLKAIFDLQQKSSTKYRFSELLLNEKLNRTFALMALCTAYVFGPLFVLGFHYLNPCKASLIGNQLITECQTDIYLPKPIYLHLLNSFKKLTVFILNIWIWHFTTNAAILTVSILMIVCPIIFKEAIYR